MSDIDKKAAEARYLETRHDATMKGWRQGRDAGHRMALVILDQSETLDEARARLVNVIDYTRPEYREDMDR